MSIAKIINQIHREFEEQYFKDLSKAQRDGCITYVVGEDTELEEEFNTWRDAKNYAKKNKIDKVKAQAFTICYGYYCDGEYRDYENTLLDLNKNIIY